MIQPDVEALKALFRNVRHGLSHAALPFSEFSCLDIEKVEHELVVVEVLAKAYMVDCVGENAFKCMREIDSCLTFFLDLG